MRLMPRVGGTASRRALPPTLPLSRTPSNAPRCPAPPTPSCSMQLEGYMVAADGQVADFASAITAFLADDLNQGWTRRACAAWPPPPDRLIRQMMRPCTGPDGLPACLPRHAAPPCSSHLAGPLLRSSTMHPRWPPPPSGARSLPAASLPPPPPPRLCVHPNGWRGRQRCLPADLIPTRAGAAVCWCRACCVQAGRVCCGRHPHRRHPLLGRPAAGGAQP